jgi:hypothetical protein
MVMALLASITVAASPAGAQDAQYASQADAVLGSAGNTQWRQAVQNVINPEDHVCIEPGAIGFWINDVINSAQPSSLDVLFPVGAPDWPIVYKLFFDDDDTDEFIGVDGDYTREHIKRQRDLINFWDVPLDDVGLYGIHGSVMADDNKMIPVVQFMLGVPPDIAQLIVDDVQYVIENDPGVGYDWPLFSFNAVAFGPDPLKVVMGDGLIEFFEDSGLATNGVDSVYAHEIGHQVQGVLGELDGPPSPEATRRIELMADAFATYYLAHARGASFNAKRALDVFESSFNAGDCGFDSDGHHGTPNQRMAASEWGAEIAQDGPRGEIKTAAQMVALFDEQLPIIVAPDAP